MPLERVGEKRGDDRRDGGRSRRGDRWHAEHLAPNCDLIDEVHVHSDSNPWSVAAARAPCRPHPSSTRARRCRASQYRALGDRSPGSVKFGSDASATLCARPTPLSSIPPHHTGIRVSVAEVVDSFDTANPPTRPGLMLMIRPAPSVIMSSARSTLSDRLVETERRRQATLQLGMPQEIVAAQRLLDHDEIERVELLQVTGVGQRVGGVRVGHQMHRWTELAPHRTHVIDIGARLNLHLDLR